MGGGVDGGTEGPERGAEARSAGAILQFYVYFSVLWKLTINDV